MEVFQLLTTDHVSLSCAHFSVSNPKGLVQIVHGAKEHKKRYYSFAKFLQENGYAVILSDNRGHGESLDDNYPLGYMENVNQIVSDLVQVTKAIQQKYPNKPLYLFGHSLGSVFARCYLQKYDDFIDKLILSGMVNYVPGVSLGILFAKMIIKQSGKNGYHKFLERLSLKNQKDDLWISVNEENLQKYRKDPLCQYVYQNQAVLTIFKAVKQMQKTSKYQCKQPDLPILSISGEGDPITGGDRGLRHSIKTFKKIGYANMNNIVYPNMNHEVLNETEKEIVYRDVLKFLQL